MCTSLRKELVVKKKNFFNKKTTGCRVIAGGLNPVSINLLCNFGEDTDTNLPEPQGPHLPQL